MTSTAYTTFKLMTRFTNLWTLLTPIMLEKQEAFVLKYFDSIKSVFYSCRICVPLLCSKFSHGKRALQRVKNIKGDRP